MPNMASMLLNQIGKVTLADQVLPVARMFIFAADPDTSSPSFAAVYVAKDGGVELVASANVIDYNPRQRVTRRQPAIVTVASPSDPTLTEQWTLLTGPCGCGSPIKRMNWTQALADHDAGLINTDVGATVDGT